MTFSLLTLAALVVFFPASTPPAQAPAPAACAGWEECRDRAGQARAAGDYEAFHDLAWRAVQARGRRDPELFFLLARAQSLSGRPHDAMVTLQRLVQEMHSPKDVSQDEDFRRVRALPGWPEVEAAIKSARDPAQPDSRGGERAREPSREPSGEPSREPPEEPSREPSGEPSPRPSWEEVARFPARPFVAGGLAYDAVSRRFVIGNLPERKLTIVERGTNRAATLSGEAAGLRDVRAIEIDRRQGDLWVISGREAESDSGTRAGSELHKLQLVSGRVLTVYAPDPSDGPSRYVDVAIGRGAGVLVLDAAGPRLVRPSRGGRTLASLMDLPEGTVTSLAPADDGRTLFVAYDDRVARVDLVTRHAERVRGGDADLSGFIRLRWHKGSLVGVQVAEGQQRIVQLRLARSGSRVISVRMLDAADAPVSTPVAVDLLEDEFYYLLPGAPEASIRRIRLK